MKRIVIVACWVGIASYCSLALTVGPSGLVATSKAQAASVRMQNNLDSLAMVHAGLAVQLESLQNQPEATAMEARSLGYLADDETAIRLPAAPDDSVPPSPGMRLSYQADTIMTDASIKEVSSLAMLATVILGMVLKTTSLRGSGGRQRDILSHEASRS